MKEYKTDRAEKKSKRNKLLKYIVLTKERVQESAKERKSKRKKERTDESAKNTRRQCNTTSCYQNTNVAFRSSCCMYVLQYLHVQV